MVPASKTGLFRLILMLLYMLCTSKVCIGSDTISLGQSLYVNQTLISKGEIFELGFFAPGTSQNLYVGIWYKKIPVRSVVWVANRDTPLLHVSDNSHLLLSEDGNLIIFSDMNLPIWSSNLSTGRSSSEATKLVLLDSGNFVLSDGFSVIWQSFDYPTDTLLPGGKVGFDKSSTNKTQVLTSWRNSNDPSPGIFSLGMDPTGSAEFFVWRNQSQIIWRSGAWDGHAFRYTSGSALFSSRFSFSYVSNEQITYFTYNISDASSTYSRHVVDYTGQMKLLIWLESRQSWAVFLAEPAQSCEVFASCGAFGVCNNNNSPRCQCLGGFQPRFPNDWSSNDSSGGCLRREPLVCDENNKSGFRRITNIRLPAYSQILDFESRYVCEFACSVNCSCTAYASSSRRCLLWNGDLVDLEQLSDLDSGEDIYIKSSDLSLDSDSGNKKAVTKSDSGNKKAVTKSDSGNKKQLLVRLVLSITLPLLICISLVYLLCHIWRKKRNQKEAKETNQNLLLLNLDISSKVNTDNIITGNIMGGKEKVIDLPQFSFSSISAATDNFSTANKLGEGGFGPVYKGNLLDGQSVAVKRLSKRSGQGLEELRNETVLIAKLQHRNLVRLLGCCIEQDEKIIIYEYMPNKSLDCFLFDPCKRDILDWRRRVHIIEGIAQGLLYLHQHSRLRIVHRDLKASNILLDGGMNPKISDFGMARIFGGDVLQANTHRIVGTYGYMSPEYAMEGLFSIKSDVFSFGVLLLEILSGKKNIGFRHSNCLSLIGYVWELWKNDRALELIEDCMQIPSSFMPLRFIHVGLLCVEESPADRPTMSDVVAMFGNEHIKLVSPKRPAFTGGGSSGSGRDNAEDCSLNDLTASVMDGR